MTTGIEYNAMTWVPQFLYMGQPRRYIAATQSSTLAYDPGVHCKTVTMCSWFGLLALQITEPLYIENTVDL